MTQPGDSAEELVKKHAPGVAAQIRRAAEEALGNEAQFRGNLARGRVFEDFAEHLDLHLQPREEYTLINGRADAVYNRFVIEYEPPGSLTQQDSQKNRHAIDQIKQYIEDLAKVEGHKLDRLAGVATDGCYFIFGRFRTGLWHVDEPIPVTSSSTERFLASLYLLSTEKALTADNLVRDFGENSNVARIAVSTLYKALAESQNPKVKVIYEQWHEQFSEVCGYEEGSPRLNIRALAKQYAIQDVSPNAFQLFFAIHSYYATFIKLLALQVVHYYVAPKLGTALPQVASYSSDRLNKYLKDMERGGLFKQLGISNFLEGDFFGWYLEIWDELVDKGIRRIVSELSNYSLVTLDADPDQTRDLLKKLYQNVMPKQIRHDLGEYYTPDWLAGRLLNQLGYTSEHDSKLHEKRLLDPACGSGTFLVLAIKRFKEHCNGRPIKEVDVLRRILSNIVGFDLNPLAVITARTNYLLALGDLLSVPRDFDVNIPVYTCDSILTPSQAEERVGEQYRMMGPEERLYKFKTVVGDFAIPGKIVGAQYIDQLASMVEECVDSKYSVEDFRKRLLQTFPLVEETDDLDIKVLEELYAKIKDLDERAVNGIWARIIKNAFAPLFCGQFDYVAGNPPWVSWHSLPGDYRDSIVFLWLKYHLFGEPEKGRLVGPRSQADLSILMMYTSIDNYLLEGGRIGFVITQSLFKTETGGRGFRQFKLSSGEPLRVTYVDDMVELQPFEGASNRTSVIIAERGATTQYPVPYTFWKKKAGRISLDVAMDIKEVSELTRRWQWQAMPIQPADASSPWIAGRSKAIKSVVSCMGESKYFSTTHKGTDTRGANGIYWVQIVDVRPDGDLVVYNLADEARKHVDSVQAAIEKDLVYPLLRGRDVNRWKAQPSAYIVIPQDYDQPSKPIDEGLLKSNWPKTYRFLYGFRTPLQRRPAFRNFDPSSQPFYMMYNVGRYTFAPFKVVWRYIATDMVCCVVDTTTLPGGESKVTVPDCKLTLVPCNMSQEAHYVCACLGSSVARFIVKSYSIGTEISTHVLKYIGIPKFSFKDKVHQGLSELSQNAHHAMSIGDEAGVKELEERIDKLSAEVWGLTKNELKEIQQSLAELRS